MATKQQHELILQKLRSKYGEKQTEQVNQDQDDNWWQKWIKDSSRITGNFQRSLYSSLEGALDFGTSLVGSGLELIGLDEASKAVHDFGQIDLTKEFIGSDFNKYSAYFTFGALNSGLGVDEWFESTYGQQERLPSIVEDFSSGLGSLAGMMIGAKAGSSVGGFLGKGSQLGSTIGQYGAITSMAGGQSYQQALNEGATGLEATGYGLLSGATEAVAEATVNKLLGLAGLGTGKFLGIGKGKPVVDSSKSALGTAIKGIMKNFTEEGAEEVFSDLVNPLLQKATYKSKESLGDLYAQVTPESLAETFVIGGLLGAFTEGIGTVTGAEELGSLEAYNLSQEVRAIEDVNDKLEKALKKGDSKKYNELLAEKDEIVKQIETKYEKFLKDVKSGKTDIESIQKQMDEITKQLENGEINPEDVVKTKRQLLARQVDYETIKDVRATVAKEMLGTTFNGKVNIEVTTEKGVKGGFDVNTNTLTVNPENLDINNFVETLLHETFHGLANTEFINEMIKTFGSQEAYQQAYDKIYEVYSKNKNTKKALKKLNAEETKAYIDEEISANVFGATFKNVNQYMRAIKKMDAKGLERLIANIKTIFDGRNKPRNYREILRLMQERRTALNNGEVKPETTKTTKPTTKYSLAEDEDGFELDEEIKEEIVADDEIIETINLEEFDSVDIELDLLENELDEIDDYIEKLDEQTKRIYEIRKAKADLGNLFEECQYLDAPVELGFGRTKFDYEGTNRYILSSLTEDNSFTIRLIKLNNNEACFALIDENLNILKTTKEKVKLEYDVYFETQMDFAKMWFNTVPDMINEYVRETYMPSEEEINRTIGEVLDSLEAEQSNNFTEETDSEGNNLSEEVVKFNKNNKMRTREGKLPFSYHGTKNSGFSIFDANLDEQNFGNYKFSGNAVNFTTTNKEMATSYTLHKDFKIRNIYNDEIVAVAEKLINKYLVPELSTSNILEISIEISDNGKIKLRLPRLYYEEYEKLGSFYQSVVPVTIDEKGYVKFDAEYEDIRDLSNRDLWKNFGIFLDYIGEARDTFGEKIFELDILENLFDINFGEVYAVYPYAENVLEIEGKNSNWNEIAFPSVNNDVENFDEIVNKVIEYFSYKNLFNKNKTIDLETWYSLSFEEIEISGKKIEPEYDGRNYSLEITDENGNKDTLDLDVIHLPLNAQKFYWDTKVIPYILEYFGIKTSTTNEIVRYALENGYDGVIIRDIYDYGSTGYINDNITTGDLYITLRTANQIKSVTNTRPTKDPDIRYSLDEEQEASTTKTPEKSLKEVSNFVKTLQVISFGTTGIETKFKANAELKKILTAKDLEELSNIAEVYSKGNASFKENLDTLGEFLVENNLTKKEFAEKGYEYLSKWNELYNTLLSLRKSILNEKSLSTKKVNSKFDRIKIIDNLLYDVYKMINSVYTEGITHKAKIKGKKQEQEFKLALKGNENKEFSSKMETIINSLYNVNKNISKNTEEDYKKQLQIAEEREKQLQEKREERALSEEEKEVLKKKQEEEARKSAEEFNKRIKAEEERKKAEEEKKNKTITPNKIKKGVRIKHSSFGNGTVSDFDNTFVTINFDNTEVGQKKMNLDFLIKNNKLELLEEELTVEQPITIEGKQIKNKYSYITVAPYFKTYITEENFNEVKEKVDSTFRQKFDFLARKLKIKYDKVFTNVGGFTYSEGKSAGEVVRELSYTFILDDNTDMQEADLLASLMGDLGYEQQEAVISARYLDVEEYSKANAIEYNIKVKEINNEVYEVLSANGLNDFTVNLEEKTIKILDFVEGYDENKVYESREIIEKFIEGLGGNYNEVQIKPIQSNYIDKSYRKGVYEQSTQRYKDSIGEGEINSYISEAQKRLEEGTTQEEVQEEINRTEEEAQPIIEEIKQEEPAVEVQPEVVKEKPKPKKKRKLVRKTFTTDEEITEFAKTLEQDASIYIATKVLFKDDNAKTVKAVADVQSNMVFEKESAVEIVEKFKKHLSKKDIGLVFRGMSRTGAENHIFELLNSITDNHTEAEVRKEIANFIKSFLAKDVELDESSKKTLNNIIKDVVDNQGRESKIHEAVRLKSEEMLIGINQYYNELKKVELTNELLEKSIEELEEKVKILNKDKQATEKQYNRVLSRVEALEKKLEKSKQINLDLSKKYKETIKNIKSQLQNEINDLKKKLSKTETKLRREQKKVEKREEQLEKYKNYKKLQETVKKVREEIKTGRMNVDLVPLIQEITNNFDNMSTRTTKPLRDAINKIYSKLNALAREGNIEFVADDGLIEAFDIVANATGNINDAEMGAYDYILKRLRQIAKDNYKERYIKHKTFTTPNGTQYAEGKINELRNEAISKKEELKQAFGGKANANTLKVLMNTSSPRVMAKFLDGYNENGINTKMFNALRVAETQKQKQIMRLLKPLNDFFKKNKKFGRLLGKRVDLLGITATNGELLSIYKLLQQTDSYEHIINNGFEVQGTEYVDFDTNEKLDKLKKTIEKHFNLGTNSVADEYLKLAKDLFHEAKLMKIETDEKLFGFSELRREIQYEYFPIQVSQEYKKQIRPDNFLSSLMGVKNLSFNKGRTGNKGKLIIGDIDYIVSNYARGMAFYYTSAELVRDYNSLYSGFVGDKTVLAHMNEVFKNTKNPAFVSKFIANMINDYQGIRKPPSFFEKLRSRTATYYLGLNIKVMAGQVSSYFSANTYLDVFNPKVVAMSFDKRLGEIEKPEYIKYRTFDSVVIQSETIGGLDSLNRSLNNIAQATTKGIQAMDALVIDRLWRIALAQNKVLEEGISKEERERRIAKATEQCELAVRETQDNYSVTERSAFARSDNIIAKLFNQFRSSQNQYWSMLVDSSMSIYTKKKLGQKVTKQDVTKLTRSATGILMQGVVYTAISMAMKALLSRKDDDEYDFSAWFTQFFNDSILGVVPAITNVINLEFDFDSEKFINVTWRDVEVSPLNLMLGSLQDLYNGGVDATEGQLGSMFSNFLNAFGKFFGIPTENVMKLGKALIVATTGETGYKVEAWLNGTEIGNKTKINSALKSNKTAKAKTYYTMYSNGIMPLDSDVIDLMFDLYSKGYENSYLKQIPDYFIIDGEQLEFDKTAFLSKYEKVSVALRKIKNNRNFKALSEEEQEACISKLVNGYYTLAKNTILGKELTNIQVLMDNDVDLSNEIIHLIKIAQFEANEKETKKEQVEKYLRKAKLDMRQKLLISYLAGYKINDENKTILKRYLTSRGVPLKVVKKLFEEEKDLTKLFS